MKKCPNISDDIKDSTDVITSPYDKTDIASN